MATKPEFPLDPEEFRRRLGVMHDSYVAKVPGKIAAIEALWQKARTALPADESRKALLLETHTLAGGSPGLGCEVLGAAAGELDVALRIAFSRGGALCDEEASAIGALVDKLRQSFD